MQQGEEHHLPVAGRPLRELCAVDRRSASSELAADLKATFVVNSNYDPTAFNNASDVMPTTGAKNGLVLGDLAGADFNDPRWSGLLDQMTFDEMNTLIANGSYQTPARPTPSARSRPSTSTARPR